MNQTFKPRPVAILPLALLAGFIAFWVAMAVAPLCRKDWLLENVLGYRRIRLSNAAYAGIFLFLLCHEVGAHYTYSEVPYDAWLSQWHIPLSGAHRNNYDRFVDFLLDC